MILTLVPCSGELLTEQEPLREELKQATKEKEELAKQVANLNKDLQSEYSITLFMSNHFNSYHAQHGCLH